MQIFPLKLLKLPKLFPLKICAFAFFVVPLHREPAPGMSAHRWRRVADIFKRRLLTLRSDVQKSRKFQQYPRNSATIDVLRDIDYPSSAISGTLVLRIYVCAYTYIKT